MVYCCLLRSPYVTIGMCTYSMFRACGCSDPVRGCVCVVSRLWRAVNPELTAGRRDLGRGAKEAKETCVGTLTHTRTHTMSSDLEGHLLRSGSLAVRAQSGSKVSPRQPHRIIPFHLIPSANCAQCDWPVSPGAPRRRLRRCLLTLCVSYGWECVGGERVAH